MPSPPSVPALLQVQNLTVSFRQGRELHRAVNQACFAIHEGELVALVGESGSGKSVSALSLLGLLPQPSAVVEGGQALFHGQDLLSLPVSELNAIRGNRISMIFQEPMTSLNPVLTVATQIGESLRLHQGLQGSALRQRTIELLSEVGIPDPERRANEYPHQLSGGMRQRVMIAMALACQPELLIADEPTTALDVTVQAQIMELLVQLRRTHGTAVLLITHNLALVREQADSVAVMYAGSIVEQAPTEELFTSPTHPYTRLLLRAIPSPSRRDSSLAVIEGQVPAPSVCLPGCRFAPRCPLADGQCLEGPPPLVELAPGHLVACRRANLPLPAPQKSTQNQTDGLPDSPLLSVRGLKVHFPVKKRWFAEREFVHAVNGVDLELRRGKTLALVGESGCGKTTVGKALIRLLSPTAGKILLGDADLAQLPPRRLKSFRRRIQMIFQDPFSSLDPRLMVGESIAEGMDAFALHRQDRQEALRALLQQVGLPEDSLTRYPHQFSGGQRQRIGLARALAVSPEILVCDECTSALDESVQAQILNLLRRLQRELRLAYLFITHDLAVVSYLANRIAVMYLGRIVEQGPCQEVMSAPRHPYTRALIAAAPRIDGKGNGKLRLAGEIPSPIHPPSGCPFHPRCPLATERCTREMPAMSDGEHQVACHFPLAKS